MSFTDEEIAAIIADEAGNTLTARQCKILDALHKRDRARARGEDFEAAVVGSGYTTLDAHDATGPDVLTGDPDWGDFWLYVDKSAGAYACWPWQDDIFESSGNGRMQLADGRWYSASRYAFMLTYGALAANVKLQYCRTPDCCNPAHMRALP